MCELFTEMRFQVVLCENPTTEEVADKCNWARKEVSDVSCFFCIVMAHGGAGNKVTMSDGEIDLREDIFSQFKGNKCKAMLGKPKIFIVNACRGKGRTLMLNIEGDDATRGTGQSAEDLVEMDLQRFKESLPAESDMLFGYATLEGNVAWRDTRKGSWFMSTLVDVIREMRDEEEFSHMLDVVNTRVMEERRAVNKDDDSETRGQLNVGQAAQFTKMGFRGKLYLR